MSDSAAPSLELLAACLRRHSPLSPRDEAAIQALTGTARVLEPSTYIVREGERAQQCGVLLSGFAYRQKLTRDGARQIVGLRVPGDALDLQSLFLDATDHNVQALTRCEVLQVPMPVMRELFESNPAVARAVVVDILIEASVGREWLLNIGRRDARTRLAHLLCEFALRVDAQGLTGTDGHELPMTQEQLGDALGVTSVHINRTLKSLEHEGVLTRRGRRIQFADWQRMQAIAGFSALYLHLGQTEPR